MTTRHHLAVLGIFLLQLAFAAAAEPLPYSAWNVTVAGPNVYFATSDHGVGIADITDPTHPVTVGEMKVNGSAESVAVVDGLACVATHVDGMRIFDLADPKHPILLGLVAPP